MAATHFVNRCKFYATDTGTGDFVPESAVQGYLIPSDAGALDTYVYSYVAETLDGLEWEIGEGTYSSGTTSFTRSVTKSSNSDALVNFSTVPVVGLSVLADAFISHTFAGAVIFNSTATFNDPITVNDTAEFNSTVQFDGTASFTVPALFADGTYLLPSIANIGDTNTGIYWSAADELAFTTAGTHAGLFDSSQRLILGHTAAISTGAANAVTPKFQAHGVDTSTTATTTYRWSADTGGAFIGMFKSRGATIGTRGIVSSGDTIGTIQFLGDDGTNSPPAASIAGAVDGTPGAGDMPGRLLFSTTSDGASTVSERMRIDSSGNVSIGGAAVQVMGAFTPRVQNHGTSDNTAHHSAFRWSADATGNYQTFAKSRHATIGSHTIVQSADVLGTIYGYGSDGTVFVPATGIEFSVDGTPGASDMPGRIIFSTTADGAATLTERLRITSAGAITIAGTTITAGGNTVWHAGNDGTGSTLDADLLDGSHASAFVTIAASSTSGFGWVIDEDTMSSNSNTKVPTQQSVKAYVDSKDTIGTQAIWVPAGSMQPTTTNGAAYYSTELATNDVMLNGYAFDTTTAENLCFFVALPKQWDEGTVTFRAYWTATAGSGGVAWSLAGNARSNDDAMDSAYGSAQTVTDTLILANDMHVTSASSAITIANTPAEADVIFFKVTRAVSNGSDTIANDVILLGIEMYITTNAGTDD